MRNIRDCMRASECQGGAPATHTYTIGAMHSAEVFVVGVKDLHCGIEGGANSSPGPPVKTTLLVIVTCC